MSNTTQLHRSSQEAAKESGSNATPLGNDNITVISEPPHRSIQIIEPAQLPEAYVNNQRAASNRPSSFYLSG